MRLIFIVSLHIIIIGVNGYITYYGVNQMKLDAQIINESGVIRGGVQKVCKLETNQINSDADIKQVDTMFHIMIDLEGEVLLNRNMNAFLQQLQSLKAEWISLKELIYRYRDERTQENKEKIVTESEHFWEHANHTVYLAQALSENKLSTFQLMFVVFFIDFLLIIGIIWLINLLVRHNLEIHSRIDPLTGAYNRNVYNEEIYAEIIRSGRYGYGFSVLLLDIDFFKSINDEYGHDKGDEILVELCQVINERIRKSDLLCRLGGEEFIILATETPLAGAIELAQNIKNTIAAYPFNISKTVTVSIGVSEWKKQDTKDTLFKRVDKALYEAKANGRNQVQVL
ncbi:GGDEF domain-containing protein [Sulfurimonas sp.]|uniref:GGDEF domain-containing protein n=1 Tax=Sulfurimonas sp. TaxID=2022749 RepID=UPI003D0FF8CB